MYRRAICADQLAAIISVDKSGYGRPFKSVLFNIEIIDLECEHSYSSIEGRQNADFGIEYTIIHFRTNIGSLFDRKEL
jgi:hypothetical protein